MKVSLLYLLLLIHLIVDFMQPASLVKWSKSSSWGLLVHSSIYTFLNALALIFTPFWWFWAIFLGISHFFLDKIKVILNDKMPKLNLLVFIVDQIFHISIITLVFYLAQEGIGQTLPVLVEAINNPQVLLYAIGYIAATFGGSILIFEVFISINNETNHKRVISIRERYRGMLERGIAMTFILLGHKSSYFPLLTPLAFLPSMIQYREVPQRGKERGRFILEVVISAGIAISASLVLYFL